MARRARGWLERFLGPLTIEGADRIDGRINVFRLAGPLGAGLLAEEESRLDGRPGALRNRSGIWVRRHQGPAGGVHVQVDLHGWDAATEAAITGDRRWLDTPKRQLFAERDRRTAALAVELDRWQVNELAAGTVPALDGELADPRVRRLAVKHQPSLLEERAGRVDIAETSWGQFQPRLAHALELMAPETFLILTPDQDRDPRSFYLQFAHATSAFRAEAIGARHLPPQEALDAAQLDELDSLGWLAPDADPKGDRGSNFRREWELPAPFADVAALGVRTLRDVFGVVAPGHLQFDHRSFEGGAVQPDLGLGLQTRVLTHHHHRPGGEPDQARLAGLIEDALRRWMGVAEIKKDADGDYPVRVGGALVYVRIIAGASALVAFFSPFLRDVPASPALHAALNDLNARIRLGRVFWTDGTVMAATELTAVDVTADQVALACMELGSLADKLDDALRGRFGGRTMFAGESVRLN